MSIVKKQAFGNSVVQYAGYIIGLINVTFLFPNIFTSDQFGLTRILIAVASVYAQFAALGTNRVMMRFMPMFRTEDNKNNGLLLIGAIMPFFGFILFTFIYYFFQDNIIGLYNERSNLFIDSYFYVVPLAFLMLYTSVIESYLMGMFRTVFSNFLRHVLIRLLWTVDILLFYFGIVDWEEFLYVIVFFYSLNLLILAIYLVARGGFSFKLTERFKRRSLYKVIGNYGFFSMFSGVSNFLVNRIDIIMIGFISVSGLNDAAVYSIAVYIASVIFVPAQAIGRISFPLIAEFWRKKELTKIKELYRASASNQLVIGGAIFVLIWANVNNIFSILPPEYAYGKWALFFLGLAKLFDMATGVNGAIINATRLYRFDLYSSIFLLVVAVTSNIVLITKYGLIGAAIATALSVLLYNLLRCIYLMRQLKMHPFGIKSLYTVLVLLAVLLLQTLLPKIGGHMVVDLVVRSTLVLALLSTSIYCLKLSEEINESVRKLAIRVRRK